MPVVSVIIPTYNRRRFLLEAIGSVFEQTFDDYELIVVDDGSTDATREALSPLIEEGRMRYEYQENRGESAARNLGVQLATGKYIAFLDSDDLFLPRKLEKQVAYMERSPEIGLVHAGYGKFNDKGDDLGYRDTSCLSGWVYPRILLEWSVFMAVPTTLIRASVLQEVGGFDESMRHAPDLDLWRRISRYHPFAVIPEMLARIRIHAGNISAERTVAGESFRRYLDKAFDGDPALGSSFRRRALARMYASVANGILGSGKAREMPTARRCSALAICFWPFEVRAHVSLFASFLPTAIRHQLAATWRRRQYQPATAEPNTSPVSGDARGCSILLLGTQMAVAGAQRTLLAHAQGFHARGHQPVVVFFYDLEGLQATWQAEMEVPVIQLNAWRPDLKPARNLGRLVRGLYRLYRLMRKEHFTIIESFTPHSNVLGLPLAWIARIPARIATQHGGLKLSWSVEMIDRFIVNSGIASCLVAVSHAIRNAAVEEAGVDPSRVRVIPNGVVMFNPDKLSSSKAREIRREIRVPRGGQLILAVARLRNEKGIDYLLVAFQQVLARFPNTRLALAGDGPQRIELEENVCALQIADAVVFLGSRSDVPELLSLADIFVLSSRQEGLPLALIEAMGMGVPTVATAVGGVQEILVDGENGLVVPPSRPEKLAGALCRLLASPNLRKKFAAAGKNLAWREFNAEQMCIRYEQLFFEVLRSCGDFRRHG